MLYILECGIHSLGTKPPNRLSLVGLVLGLHRPYRPYLPMLQINLIRQQSETLISQIQDYKQEKTTKVITFLEELMTKKDNIDAVRVSAHKFLGNIISAYL